MIEQKYIDEVLDKVDLTEVAEDYGITLKLKGHRAWACCPFHNEQEPLVLLRLWQGW